MVKPCASAQKPWITVGGCVREGVIIKMYQLYIQQCKLQTTSARIHRKSSLPNKCMYSTRYAIRTSPSVRTHSYIHTYATGEPLVPVKKSHILVLILCALVFSASYLVVPHWYQLVVPVAPVVIRAHTTTKLHELKTALDGRIG